MRMTRKLPPTSANEDRPFFEQVYDLVRLIPYGRVTSYGALAAALGSPGAARMVGWALNKCHSVHPPVPAHRVVNRKGLLSGKHFFPGEGMMRDLLVSEGVRVEDDRICDFADCFWDPSTALDQL